MAHKGRLYEVRQNAREVAGNVPWPAWPALKYMLELNTVEIDGITYSPADQLLLPVDDDLSPMSRDWRSEAFEIGPWSCRVGLRLWHPTWFIFPFQVHQLTVEDVDQYEWIDESTYQSNTWEFVTTYGPLQTPAVGGFGQFLDFVQSNAVEY